jgi:hypothetical protein
MKNLLRQSEPNTLSRHEVIDKLVENERTKSVFQDQGHTFFIFILSQEDPTTSQLHDKKTEDL